LWNGIASDAFNKFTRTVFWSSEWDRQTSALKNMATNQRLRATVFFVGASDFVVLQGAEWCLNTEEWYDVILNSPEMVTGYIRASSVPAIALHSSNFTEGMVLKTMYPDLKLALGKKNMYVVGVETSLQLPTLYYVVAYASRWKGGLQVHMHALRLCARSRP
jgi:hypothetical protein